MPFVKIHHLTGLKSFSISAEITPHPLQTVPCVFPRFFRRKIPTQNFILQRKYHTKMVLISDMLINCSCKTSTTTFIMELKIPTSLFPPALAFFLKEEQFYQGSSLLKYYLYIFFCHSWQSYPRAAPRINVYTCPSTGLVPLCFQPRQAQLVKEQLFRREEGT